MDTDLVMELANVKGRRLLVPIGPGESFTSEGITYTYDEKGRLFVDIKQVQTYLLEAKKELEILNERESISSKRRNENLQQSGSGRENRGARFAKYNKRRAEKQ